MTVEILRPYLADSDSRMQETSFGMSTLTGGVMDTMTQTDEEGFNLSMGTNVAGVLDVQGGDLAVPPPPRRRLGRIGRRVPWWPFCTSQYAYLCSNDGAGQQMSVSMLFGMFQCAEDEQQCYASNCCCAPARRFNDAIEKEIDMYPACPYCCLSCLTCINYMVGGVIVAAVAGPINYCMRCLYAACCVKCTAMHRCPSCNGCGWDEAGENCGVFPLYRQGFGTHGWEWLEAQSPIDADAATALALRDPR